MPTIITRGAGSAQGLGYAASSTAVNYIEDVFSTYLYTGNASTQTITNGIDLSGKGGLVWIKNRPDVATAHALFDTVRGATKYLQSQATSAEGTQATSLTAFNSNGYSLGAASFTNNSGTNYASWTFREQPKFFDIVTYTGNGTNYRTISHSLGSTPGCVIVKSTSAAGNWAVYHRGSNPDNLILNSTSGAITGQLSIQDVSATSFGVANSSFYGFPQSIPVNDSGQTYVAYLFAHDAGGFGLTGTDNVISCGSVTTDGSGNATVNLGYEPQWLLSKWTTTADNWHIYDDMRGWSVNVNGTSSNANDLYPNSSDAETNRTNNEWYKTSTGFAISGSGASRTYIYIAIRRGPMKVPTDATKVFAIDTRHATVPTFVSNFPVDMSTYRAKSGSDWYLQSRLTPKFLLTNSTAAESAGWVFNAAQFTSNTGWGVSPGSDVPDVFSYMFRRAPGFFDVVCYTGTGGTNLQTHNLGVTPELLIIRSRSQSGTYGGYWLVLSASGSNYRSLFLNTTDSNQGNFAISSISTSTTVNIGYIGSNILTASNTSAATFVAYLFATVAGVSKVGTYTGTGTTQTINCGFTAGARFVLIKRTDSTGDWYVWDSARGIVAGNDPYLLLNSTAAEVTGADYVDTASSGFEISSTAPAAINANGGSFIFLAIA